MHKPAPRTSPVTRTSCRIRGCTRLVPVLSLPEVRAVGAP